MERSMLKLKIAADYEIVEYSKLGGPDRAIVLAALDKGDRVEYASWIVEPSSGVCYWGDYYTGVPLDGARAFYLQRLEKARSAYGAAKTSDLAMT
jgi:hypothetical protein